MTATLTRSCACGCGQAVRTDSRSGRSRRYVLGHNPTPGRTPLPPAPDPNAPEDAPRCAACPYPLVYGSHAGPPPPGWRWHQGRGLCSHCYQRARYRGEFTARRQRTRDDVLDEWDWLRRDGVGRVQAAARIGITLAALERHLFRARKDGDPRAVLGNR